MAMRMSARRPGLAKSRDAARTSACATWAGVATKMIPRRAGVAKTACATVLVAVVAPLLGAEAAGVPGFVEVNEHIYRGGQPTGHGLESLTRLGVKTVIDLTGGEEEAKVEAAGMKYVHVPMHSLAAPSDEDIRKILAVLDDSAGWPVFVHCRRGKDRTGVAIACYRIAHDGWTNEKALEEARLYGLSWLERGMIQYILAFRAK